MSPSLVSLFRFLNIFLLISGQQCLSDSNSFSTVSSNQRPSDPRAIVLTSIPFGVTRSSTASSNKSELHALPVEPQINTFTIRHAKAVPSSVTRTQAQIKSGLEVDVLSARRRRALLGDLDDPFSSHLGPVHSSNTQAGSLAQRQLIQSPFSTVPDNRLTFTSRLPIPTQAPSTTNDLSRSRLPVTTSTASTYAQSMTSQSMTFQSTTSQSTTWQSTTSQSTTSRKHPSTSTAMASQPSKTPSITHPAAPQTPLQKLASYYKSSHRLAPLAIILTVGLAFGSLVTFVSLVKCLCHRKRFANKKDYPEGFPWQATFSQMERGESRRKGLLSHTATVILARNSITPSAHFAVGQLNPESRVNSYYVDYQLNDLRSPSDVDAHYAFGLPEDIEKVFENDKSGSSDESPSSSSMVDSRELPPLELNPLEEKWDMRSANGPSWLSEGGMGKKS